MDNGMHILRHERKFLLLLVMLAFAVRFIAYASFFSKETHYWNDDSQAYHMVAKQIAAGKGITNTDGSPNTYRVPGYAFFLAWSYKVVSADLSKALWVQVVVASFIPLLIFFLTAILFSQNILLARIVALCTVFHLGFVLYSCIAMTETLFMLFFLLFLICFFYRYEFFFFAGREQQPSLWLLFGAGLFLGCLSLIRPVGHYLLLLSLGMLALSKGALLVRLKKMTVLSIAWLIVAGWWLLRNVMLFGHLFFHTLPGVHFLRYTAVPIVMKSEGRSYGKSWEKLLAQRQEQINNQELSKNRPLNEIEKCLLSERLALRYVLRFPMIALRYAIFNWFKTSVALYSSELLYIDSGLPPHCFETGRGWWSLCKRFIIPRASHPFYGIIVYVEMLFHLFLLIGFFGGIFWIVFYRNYFASFLQVLPLITLFIVITLASGFARVRLPIEPFLLMVSCYFWLVVMRWLAYPRPSIAGAGY